MFHPFPLYIGFRYTRAKRRNHFISFIALISVLGIALGITVLITVLSVMNGFDYEIHNRIFGLARQVTITSVGSGIEDWRSVSQMALQHPKVKTAAPFVLGQGMLANDGLAQGVMINGVLPTEESKVSQIPSRLVKGSWKALRANSFSMVLGKELALRLGVDIGDKIVLVTPQATSTLVGVVPRFKRFTVAGIFQVGGGFGYDNSVVFINLNDAQKLLQMGNLVSGVNLKINDLYAAPEVTDRLLTTLPHNLLVKNWTDEYGSFFQAIRMEKTTMFVVLMFIIAVATFNLVSSLVMTVTDKQSDIAILRTLGASPQTIMAIFIIQGGIIGAFGSFLGIISGVILAINAPDLVRFLEYICNTHFISSVVYFIDYLPSKLEWKDVWHVGIASLVMSLLATIYPAWRASKTQPAEALRYE